MSQSIFSLQPSGRTTSADKLRKQGRVGIDHSVALSTHTDHDPLICRKIGEVDVSPNRVDELARNCGGNDVREKILRLIRGGKARKYGHTHKRGDGQVRVTPSPNRMMIAGTAQIGGSEGAMLSWAEFRKLALSMSDVTQAINNARKEGEAIRVALSAPLPNAVCAAPIMVGCAWVKGRGFQPVG